MPAPPAHTELLAVRGASSRSGGHFGGAALLEPSAGAPGPSGGFRGQSGRAAGRQGKCRPGTGPEEHARERRAPSRAPGGIRLLGLLLKPCPPLVSNFSFLVLKHQQEHLIQGEEVVRQTAAQSSEGFGVTARPVWPGSVSVASW